jgi:hypothetical protein
MACVFKEDISRFSIRRHSAEDISISDDDSSEDVAYRRDGASGAVDNSGGGDNDSGGGGGVAVSLFIDGRRSDVGLLHFNGGSLTRDHMYR